MGPGHPECPERLDAIEDRLLVTGVADALERYEAPEASLADIELAHDRLHMAAMRGLSDLAARRTEAGGPAYTQVDPTPPSTCTPGRAALRSAGRSPCRHRCGDGRRAGKRLLRGAPAGPPRLRDKAMGFCFFNNVAVAAKYALQRYNLQRVAVVDFDVHHGNGTEDILAGETRALMVSIFQHPFYPYSGDQTSGAQHGQRAGARLHARHGHPRNDRDDVDSAPGGLQARDDFHQRRL
jgi:acetoin utilization deacetylase AcuC-like enzyme